MTDKEKIKITSSEQYNELLDKFRTQLQSKIPYHENCLVQFQQPQDPSILMQFGGSAVICRLETNSSKLDHYLIYLNNNNEAEFIRLVMKGDKL